ncbi:MAG: sensor domain-containing diguanylate cyclase [Agarilytica sp.]
MAENNHELFAQIGALQDQLDKTQEYLRAEREARALSESKGDTIDLDALLKLLGNKIQELEYFDGYMINLFSRRGFESGEESKEQLICEKILLPAGYEAIEKTYHKYRFPILENDANTLALKRNQPVYISKENCDEFSENTQTRFKRWEMQSMVCIPIISYSEDTLSEERLGTIIAFIQDGDIQTSPVQQVQHLTAFFYKQINHALHYSNLKEREKEIRNAQKEHNRFLKFISTVNNLTNTEQIYEQITDEFLRRFPFELIGVFLKEGEYLNAKKFAVSDANYQVNAAALTERFSKRGYEIHMADGATPTALMQNSHLMFPDVQTIMHLPMSEKDRMGLSIMGTPRTFLIMPIRRQDEVIGILWLISMESPISLPESSIKLIELLCTFIGSAISNAQLYSLVEEQNQEIEVLNANLQQKVEELHEIASKDRLTGLYNFGSFEQELKRRINEYSRDPSLKFCIVLFDVDHFKKFNDTYGHLAGNDVLQELASRIRKQVREMDIPCRYGGEEFCVILPKCRLEGAKTFAERLRASIADEFFIADGSSVQVTVSLGCAEFDTNEPASRFIERTDKALYLAKEDGRNCVRVSEAETTGSTQQSKL